MQMQFFIGFFIGGVAAVAAAVFYFRAQLLRKDLEFQNLQKTLEQQTTLQQVFGEKFENLANRIFEEKQKSMGDQNTKNLTMLLEPFRDRLKDFEKKVDDTYSSEKAERHTLKSEINKLMDLNIKTSSETHSLTQVLKGDVKAQGAWGEMVLENILESSGLRKDEEYIVQGSDMSLKNEDGESIKPDIIVKLPDNKHIIVDSKVSLKAYYAYSNATTKEEQDKYAQLHLESLKAHIDGLSKKKYQTSSQLMTPDFVILFMPVEPAFSLAFKIKPDLTQYVWDRNIAIVSPTTLFPTLRTVANLWKLDRQEKNAMEIAKRGGALYDKFAGLIEDLEEVGKKLDSAVSAHESVRRKMSEGTGNLVWQAAQLQKLGAKTTKRLQIESTEEII